MLLPTYTTFLQNIYIECTDITITSDGDELNTLIMHTLDAPIMCSLSMYVYKYEHLGTN